MRKSLVDGKRQPSHINVNLARHTWTCLNSVWASFAETRSPASATPGHTNKDTTTHFRMRDISLALDRVAISSQLTKPRLTDAQTAFRPQGSHATYRGRHV